MEFVFKFNGLGDWIIDTGDSGFDGEEALEMVGCAFLVLD